MSDWYLFDAGWLFFAAWSVVVAVVSVAAFGRDLFPAKVRLEPGPQTPAQKQIARETPPQLT